MSYLLFMDESGHDHKNMPYEVRGGISIASIYVFKLIQDLQFSEEKIFGCKLSEFKTEIKGSKLLSKERFKWAKQMPELSNEDRQKGCRRFLTANLEKRPPTKQDFTAYGQASLKMVTTILNLLCKYKAHIFACVIEKGVEKPDSFEFEDYLRKDHICLMERFAHFLENNREDGLLIMDQCEKECDKKFKKQLANYFSKTTKGRQQAHWIIPEPFFIESDINYLIQVADLCIYAINTGYRLSRAMNADARPEVQDLLEERIADLEYKGIEIKNVKGEPKEMPLHGIKFYKNPYFIATKAKKKR